MKRLKLSIIIIAFFFFISCTNNNQNTGGIDSASVSTNPGMGGSTDTGMTSSDSTDIRMPMAQDSSRDSTRAKPDSIRR